MVIMLHGIDISNWQKGITVPESLGFCVCKATEGLTFVDRCCDGFVQQCRRKGIPFGFYHFMTSADPEQQALFFHRNTEGYSLEGIPVLDVESDRIEDWGSHAQGFVDKYHACTGVYPVIYASASALGRFAGYPLVDDCGLWVAGYPDGKVRGLGDVPEFPYDVSPWKFAAIWQYTSNGRVGGWNEPVDLDVAFMDQTAWHLYANPNDVPPDATAPMPVPGDPDESSRKWHFENAHVSVDVELR